MQTQDNAPPQSIAAALRLLMTALTRDRALFYSGMVGIGIGAVGILVYLIQGPIIEPEGVLRKAISFDVALGIYVLSVALWLPLVPFSERGLRRWRRWHVTLTYIAYAIENIQIGRGLDPRFSSVAGPADQSIGGFFLLVAIGMVVLFVIVAVKLVRNHELGPLAVAFRYAIWSTVIAFAAGFWMSFGQGPFSGDASILPLHAIGFHGLQAIPLVAVLLGWANMPDSAANRIVHTAGFAWLLACIVVAIQTIIGRPILELSMLPILVFLLLLWWTLSFLRSFLTWQSAAAHD